MADNFINCNTFQGIALQCKTGIGGIKNAWISAYSGFSFIQDAQNIVTGVTTGATTLYEITPARTSSNVVEDQVIDNTNTTYKQTITLMFVDDSQMRNFVSSLAKSITVLVVQDRKDNFKIYGTENGLQLHSTHNTGTVETDKNAYTLVFEGTEAYAAPYVSASVMTPFM